MKIYIFSLIFALNAIIYYAIYKRCKNDVKTYNYWPIVMNQWNKNDNLRTMKRIFDRMDYKMVNGDEEHWDIMWSLEFPFDMFPEKLENLNFTSRKLNHIPGMTFLANKMSLATLTPSIYIPPAFYLPNDYRKFELFVMEHPKKKFVVKNFDNRGVEIISLDDIRKGVMGSQKFIQVFIDNPLLIDDHAFDMGVYVLITSLNPLVIYRFKSECLFRFCPEIYHPFDVKNLKKYVVGNEKMHAWEMKSLKDFDGKFHTLKIFENYLKSHGHDVSKLWNKIDDAITSVILTRLNPMIKEFHFQCDNFNCKNENFFELFRFDFVIDDEMNLHLMEINMSPNLTPSDEKYERNNDQYERVVYNTLRLIGVEGFVEFKDEMKVNNPQDISVDLQSCKDCINSCENPSCELCLNCISADLIQSIHESYREHHRRGEFKRIFPSNKYNADEDSKRMMTEKMKILGKWFDEKCKEDESWC